MRNPRRDVRGLSSVAAADDDDPHRGPKRREHFDRADFVVAAEIAQSVIARMILEIIALVQAFPVFEVRAGLSVGYIGHGIAWLYSFIASISGPSHARYCR